MDVGFICPVGESRVYWHGTTQHSAFSTAFHASTHRHLTMELPFLSALAGWAIASVAALGVSLASRDNIAVTLLAYTTPSSSTLSLLNEDAELWASSCSSKLDDGPFHDFVIAAEFDHVGSGHIMVGPQTYVIHENPSVSGGIICGAMYNDEDILVTCKLFIPGRLLYSAKRATPPNCATQGLDKEQSRLKAHLSALLSPNTSFTKNDEMANCDADVSDQGFAQLDRPKRSACTVGIFTELVGDGNPHQNYHHRQITVSNLL